MLLLLMYNTVRARQQLGLGGLNCFPSVSAVCVLLLTTCEMQLMMKSGARIPRGVQY
jgi:hypothetical protein